MSRHIKSSTRTIVATIFLNGGWWFLLCSNMGEERKWYMNKTRNTPSAMSPPNTIKGGDGWIKFYRKTLLWEWFTNPNVFHIFATLMLSANHKDGRWQGMEVLAGQHITSIEKLSQKTGLSFQQVRTAFNKLKSTGEITTETTNKYTIVTVVNWAFYQGEDENANKPNNTQSNKQITNHPQANNNQITTNKNDKNLKNENNEENKPTPPSAVEDKPPQESYQSFYDNHNKYNEPKSQSNQDIHSKTIQADKGAVINDYGFSMALNQAVDNWLTYKAEKRQAYKPSGQSSLLHQIQKNAQIYGDNAVIHAIEESMASNYQGIVWDKAKTHAMQRDSQKKGSSFFDLYKELDGQEQPQQHQPQQYQQYNNQI